MLFAIPKAAEQEVKETSGDVMAFDLEQHYPGTQKLDAALALVDANRCIHWVSDGDWSMHDLLMGLLDITGPADVYLSSWAFSEYPARIIADLVSRKVIKKLYCLIDKRLDTRNASALNIIRNIATRLSLTNTHAKVTVIENEQISLVVIGSANYTTNKRYETGVIIVDREATNFHKKWMTHALDENK